MTSGEKELNYCKARVDKTICVFDRSQLLVCSSLILDRAWRVWSGCEVKCFCCITGTEIIYSFHGFNLYANIRMNTVMVMSWWLVYSVATCCERIDFCLREIYL